MKFYNEKSDQFWKNLPEQGTCYLFSSLSFNNWKEYIDHENQSKDAKTINLKLHKKPENINQELIKADKDLLIFPDKEHPCTVYLKSDLLKDRDYIIVSQEIWEYFEKKYG